MEPTKVVVDLDVPSKVPPPVILRCGKKVLDKYRGTRHKYPTGAWQETVVDVDDQDYNLTLELFEGLLIVKSAKHNKTKPRRT